MYLFFSSDEKPQTSLYIHKQHTYTTGNNKHSLKDANERSYTKGVQFYEKRHCRNKKNNILFVTKNTNKTFGCTSKNVILKLSHMFWPTFCPGSPKLKVYLFLCIFLKNKKTNVMFYCQCVVYCN